MIDKVGIAAENYYKAECADLANQEQSLVHIAYVRGFRAGVVKATTKRKPQTHADAIRAMDDEDLAEFLQEPHCNRISGDDCKNKYLANCTACLLDWLRQEAD